jgi:hypothetical protein
MEELRDCTVMMEQHVDLADGGYETKRRPVKAKFHRWCDGLEFDDNKTFQYTFALVELEDGSINKVDPSAVTMAY